MPTPTLQWGRNFIVAEIAASHRAATRSLRASMGPQLYRCGNDTLYLDAHQNHRCFNGAATLSLRKLYQVTTRRTTLACFNGAATLSLRKSGRLLSLTLPSVASMEPQLYRCGNGSTTSCGSWNSPSFNGAATLSLRKFNVSLTAEPTAFRLQWGRNFIVAEILDAGCGFFSLADASMGPQLYRCGNHSCDNLAFSIHRSLQWGRNFIVAEIYFLPMGKLREEHASMGPQLYRCGNKPLEPH